MIALANHRHQALSLHREPDRSAGIAAITSQPAVLALDCLEQGVFVLDATLHVHFASAAAKRLIATDRMRIRNEHLCSPVASETIILRRLVEERIAATSAGRAQMTFHRLDGAEDVLCLGITASYQPPEPPLAIVLVAKPSQIALPDVHQLRNHFGLTEAQARLGIEIAKGHGLQVCARRLGIAVTTARTHLKQIFAKTDTRRQAEFVRLAYACRFPVPPACSV